MVLFHDILDLVQVLLRQLIAVFKYGSNLVVDHVERVEVLLLEMSLLGLIHQQRYLICDFLVIFDTDLNPPIVHVDHFHQLKRQFTVFALKPRCYIFILTVFTDFLFLKISIGLGCR